MGFRGSHPWLSGDPPETTSILSTETPCSSDFSCKRRYGQSARLLTRSDWVRPSARSAGRFLEVCCRWDLAVIVVLGVTNLSPIAGVVTCLLLPL